MGLSEGRKGEGGKGRAKVEGGRAKGEGGRGGKVENGGKFENNKNLAAPPPRQS